MGFLGHLTPVLYPVMLPGHKGTVCEDMAYAFKEVSLF